MKYFTIDNLDAIGLRRLVYEESFLRSSVNWLCSHKAIDVDDAWRDKKFDMLFKSYRDAAIGKKIFIDELLDKYLPDDLRNSKCEAEIDYKANRIVVMCDE